MKFLEDNKDSLGVPIDEAKAWVLKFLEELEEIQIKS